MSSFNLHIHARYNGAALRDIITDKISIHTFTQEINRSTPSIFNPHTFQPAHGVIVILPKYCTVRFFSIHTLATIRKAYIFNPRIYTRCNIDNMVSIIYSSISIRTRCDKYDTVSLYHQPHFNPRIRARCDSHCSQAHNQYIISIHTSAQDATLRDFKLVRVSRYFNPHIRAGCDSNNINVFYAPVYDVRFPNQSLTQFRVCFMSYLGDFKCEPPREFL